MSNIKRLSGYLQVKHNVFPVYLKGANFLHTADEKAANKRLNETIQHLLATRIGRRKTIVRFSFSTVPLIKTVRNLPSYMKLQIQTLKPSTSLAMKLVTKQV